LPVPTASRRAGSRNRKREREKKKRKALALLSLASILFFGGVTVVEGRRGEGKKGEGGDSRNVEDFDFIFSLGKKKGKKLRRRKEIEKKKK